MWKIPTQLYGTNFCTTSASFAPSFVRQPNSTKCTQIVWNTPKHEFRSQRSQSGMFVAKNYEATSWHDLLHQFGPFCNKFLRQPNGSKYIQIVQNAPKHVFRVQWGGSGAFVAKNFDATSLHELLHQFGPFCTECCNIARLSQMQPNCTKRTKTRG